MKKDKIIFWLSTGIIFIMEGILPAFTSQTEMAKEGIRGLGYPDYFGVLLAVFKVLGSIALVLSFVPKRVKEWAYAGFGFDFIFAFISIWAVVGFNPIMLLLPFIFMILLIISYVYYNKLNNYYISTNSQQ